MGPKIKKNTLYAKVLNGKIVMVEISIHPECLQGGQTSKENKANIKKLFTKDHFDRLILKLQDVILAKVLAPPDAVDKKKGGKTSCDHVETLPDPELFIQYQFVRKRNYKQIALTRHKQGSVADSLRSRSRQCGYSGGDYQSHNFFPQKLIVTVSLTSQVAHQKPSVAGVDQHAKDRPPARSKSTISKYFNKDSDTASETRSTQKKRAALKNMNKKNESQKKIDSLFCSNSSASDNDEAVLKEMKSEKAKSDIESVGHGDTQQKDDHISWVNERGSKIKVGDVLPLEEGENSKVKTDEESGSDILSRDEEERNHAPNDSSKSCSMITSGLSPKRKDLKASISEEDIDSDRSGLSLTGEEGKAIISNEDIDSDRSGLTLKGEECKPSISNEGTGSDTDRAGLTLKSEEVKPSVSNEDIDSDRSGLTLKGEDVKARISSEDVDSDKSGLTLKSKELKPNFCSEGVESRKHIKTCETLSNSKELKAKPTDSTTSKLKRRRSFETESDSTDVDSMPSLRSRLAKKMTQKKPKTIPPELTEGSRDETGSVNVTIGDDNDFESPKARRLNTGKRKGSDLSDDQELMTSVFSTSSEVPPSSSGVAKERLNVRRKTKKTDTKRVVSEKNVNNPTKKRVYKRRVKATTKTTAEVLEDANEEPGSSPLEPITIEDKPPMTIDVSCVEELTAEQTEHLVWEHAKKLREIFEGKTYCRRHEDYKKGGKMKGDLAFQVQFGTFSEEQRDIIMEVLTNMFCYKHTKYFDYVSKVLLPETLVMLCMKVEGKTRDEAELLLLEAALSSAT